MNLFKNEYVETHAGDLHIYKDRTQAGDIVFITANNFKKYVPIEWIKEYAERGSSYFLYAEETKATIKTMLEEWEKENEHR